MNQSEIWLNFLNNIADEIHPSSFSLWFSELKLISITDNEIIIQAPSEMHKKMLEGNYFNLIESTIYNITKQNFDIKFVLESEQNNIIDNPQENNEPAFETNLNPNLNFDNFIVGETNRLAKVAAMAVAENPGKMHNPLFLYGKSGLGKTHLMHAIGNYITKNSDKRVLYTTSDDFMNDYIGVSGSNQGKNTIDYANNFKKKYRDVDVLIIDDIQYLVGAEKTQQEFFHTFNALHQANKQIIISSDRSPDDLKILEERLRSRFMWGLPVDIYPPDFDLRCRIVKKKLESTTIKDKIEDNVIEYIANSCTNDVRFLEGAINRLMAYTAMIVPNKIDLDFACEALKDFVNKNIYSNNSIQNIQKAVADFHHITIDDLKSKKRSKNIAYPRQIAMYLCREQTEENLATIGLDFGGRDHSTVIFAYEKIKKDLKTNSELQEIIDKIKSKL